MNTTIKILFFSLVITIFGCSDDKASSAQQAATTTKSAKMATPEPVMAEKPKMEEEAKMDSMEVPPWASLEQEVIHYAEE